MKTAEAFGYMLFADQPENIAFNKKTVIHTINQYSYCVAQKDDDFNQALKSADVLLPDGIGITKGTFLLHGKKLEKIAGADIHQYLLEKMNRQKGTCFYLGSTNETLTKIKEKIAHEYPDIHVATYSPPYKSTFSPADSQLMISKINAVKPDVLFVGMTAPKQEKWVENNKHLIQANTICTIGAVFDFYSDNVKRANPIFIKFGMEWMVRLFKEPKRMWRRYLYYGPAFIFQILKSRIRQSSI